MASVWQNNKLLKKWENKNFKNNCNGDFNYNLAYPLNDPLVIAISEYLNIDKNYVYVGAGISQFITALVGLKIWNRVFLSKIEFSLYKRAANLNEQKVSILEGIYAKDILFNLSSLKSSKNDLLCLSSPRWFSGELFSKKDIINILNQFKGTIIIDEAYIDYSDSENGIIDLCMDNERIIMFRSFSKKFLASGFRTGYMITKKKIDGMRNTIIPPHSVTSYSENFFAKLLSDKKMLNAFKETREYIKCNRDLIYDLLKDEKKINIIKSNANFISIVFKDTKTFNLVYNNLKDLAGIQKFDEVLPFIKIWANNEMFSKEVIKRIKEVLK